MNQSGASKPIQEAVSSPFPSLSSFFAVDGPIARSIEAFETREQQTDMALAVRRSLREKKHLIIEAGTGVGKSLAYLVPCALWAVKNRKKVVVATYTKALQEQLVKKDLPIVQAAFHKEGLSLQYSLLMGSENYLCLSRLQRCLRRGPGLFDIAGLKRTQDRLIKWSGKPNAGLRMDIPFKVPDYAWAMVCRDSDLCLGRHCSSRELCLYRKAVARARQADLVVANQHLFFAGIPIPAFEAVVFDEAHNLEDVASQFLGFTLTDRKVKRLLDDIHNPQTGRGLAKRLRHQPGTWFARIEEKINDARFAARTFFQDIRGSLSLNAMEESKESRAKRIREPHIVEDILSEPIQDLSLLLSQAVAHSQSAEEELEIKAHENRCVGMLGHLEAFLKCDSRDHVYWVEVSLSKRGSYTSLNKSPLDVSQALRKELFAKHPSVILTSATLTVDSSFAMMKSRLGLDDSLEVLLGSPFDYENQAVIHNCQDIPDPKQDSGAYEKAVIEHCPDICETITGGVFVLFTSWRLLEKCSKVMTAASMNRPVFKQGEKAPRQLLNDFKESGNGLLLATDTFWQGIDVPGSALSCVIITRLPFLSPDSPLEEARHEWMAARGMNVFKEYTLPKAIIKFRQGFGRLIRSKTDFGAVSILDPRIRTKHYGAMFLRSIPKCRQVNTLEELGQFFHRKRSNLWT